MRQNESDSVSSEFRLFCETSNAQNVVPNRFAEHRLGWRGAEEGGRRGKGAEIGVGWGWSQWGGGGGNSYTDKNSLILFISPRFLLNCTLPRHFFPFLAKWMIMFLGNNGNCRNEIPLETLLGHSYKGYWHFAMWKRAALIARGS